MKNKLAKITGALIALFAVENATSAIIFQNAWTAPPNGNNCFHLTCYGTDRVGAERFDLSNQYTLSGFTFDVLRNSSINSALNVSIDWFIFSDGSGAPGSVISSGTSAGTSGSAYGQYSSSYRNWRISFDIPEFVTTASSYWIGFDVNHTTSDPLYWLNSSAATPAKMAAKSNLNTWGDYPTINSGAFQVIGDVYTPPEPEPKASVPSPATLGLIGLGLLGMRSSRKRMKGV